MWATSFSVVQNTTFGLSPPGRRLSARRNSYPSIFGMFQSSRTASGRLRWQASSACSPSSASVISKSSPSRIRRATLRMTLESSTTKQLFIATSLLSLRTYCADSALSCGQCFAAHIENPINVENNEKLSIETMNTSRDACKTDVEVDRIGLAHVVVEL